MTFILNAKQHKELYFKKNLSGSSFIFHSCDVHSRCFLYSFMYSHFSPSNGLLLLFSGVQETLCQGVWPLNAGRFIFVELVPHCSCSKEKLHER